MSEFNIGVTVVRTGRDNGGFGAKIGTRAEVIKIIPRDRSIVVVYPGYDPSRNYPDGEVWCNHNSQREVAAALPEPVADSWAPAVGDKGKTRDGEVYEVFAVLPIDRCGAERENVVALVGGQLHHYFADGRYLDNGEAGNDLLPPKRIVYVNFYRSGGCYSHETEDAARCGVGQGAIAVAVPVELPLQ